MSDHDDVEGLRERLTKQGEDTLGKLAEDLMANPLVAGAIQRAFDAREKASSAQEAALGALMLPVGRRHRAPHAPCALGLPAPGGHRGRHRPHRRAGSPAARPPADGLDARLEAIEGHLSALTMEIAQPACGAAGRRRSRFRRAKSA